MKAGIDSEVTDIPVIFQVTFAEISNHLEKRIRN